MENIIIPMYVHNRGPATQTQNLNVLLVHIILSPETVKRIHNPQTQIPILSLFYYRRPLFSFKTSPPRPLSTAINSSPHSLHLL